MSGTITNKNFKLDWWDLFKDERRNTGLIHILDSKTWNVAILAILRKVFQDAFLSCN